MGSGMSQEEVDILVKRYIDDLRSETCDSINSRNQMLSQRLLDTVNRQVQRLDTQNAASHQSTKEEIKRMVEEMEKMKSKIDEDEKKKKAEKEKKDEDRFKDMKNVLDQIKEKLSEPQRPRDPYSVPPGMYPPWYSPWYPPPQYGAGPSNNSPNSYNGHPSPEQGYYGPWNGPPCPGSPTSSSVPPNSPGFHPNKQSSSFYDGLNSSKAKLQDTGMLVAKGVKDFFLKTWPKSKAVNDDDADEAFSDASSTFSEFSSVSTANQYGKHQKKHYPSEEEALRRKLDLSKPLPKAILFLGKNKNGGWITHEPKCLKDIYALEKIYEVFRIVDLSEET